MSVAVLLGAQWGDEGKGKLIDFLIDNEKVDITARCQGGDNAGHTVIANGRSYDFHILPSGVISERCINMIGNGVVVNLESFFSELEKNGITKDLPGWEKRIFISNRAHIIFNIHKQVDGRQEESLGATSKIGTTNKGIGPTYSSKCFRNGIRMADLMGDFDAFSNKYETLVRYYTRQFNNVEVNTEEELEKFRNYAETLRELDIVKDTSVLLYEYREQGKTVLVEGANGALLDIDFGTFPYVTSSNSTVGGACTGLGIPPTSIKRVIGVVKAYQSRVGTGPFPTEQINEIGEKLQDIGKEVGVTTGRKRRCGWVDLFLLKHSHIVNGFTEFALTKLDILDTFPEIMVGVGYKLNGESLKSPPARAADWDVIEVEYKTFPGWLCKTSDIRKFEDLPETCQTYVKFIEDFVGVPIKFIGVGQSREALIVRQQ